MNEYEWYGLDNAAKIFPAISGNHTSSVFRVDARIKEKVKPKILEESVNRVLLSFPSFRVRIRAGIFWYYLESNSERAIVTQEDSYPCSRIDTDNNAGYLFKFSYFQNKINLDVYHALSDGTGAINFLKEVISCYFALCGEQNMSAAPQNSFDRLTTEDSYSKIHLTDPVYDSKKTKKIRAFHLKGTPREKGHIKVIHGILEADDFVHLAKNKNVTVTAYLAAMLGFSILRATSRHLLIHPIRLSVPINLRRFFKSETQRNFFTFITIDIDAKSRRLPFDDLLQIVSKQLTEKTKPEYFMPQINYYIKSERNIFARVTPLFAKNLALRFIHSRAGDETYTCTLSNLGKIDVNPEIQNKIDRFDTLVGTSRKNHMNCGVSSYQNQLVITFTLSDYETDVEKKFFQYLVGQGMKIVLEQNLSEDS